MSASPQSDRDLQQLAEAFDTFNLVSNQLENSYASLERRMAGLRAELATVREQRRVATADNVLLEQRISGILEALPGGVVVIDKDGRLVNANRRARSWLPGLEPGVDWSDISSVLFENAFSEHGDLVLRDGKRFIVTQERGAGDEHIILLTDVTEQREVDEILARHNRLAGVGEMLATLAHQMRTPITAALLYLSNAQAQDEQNNQRSRLLENSASCLRDLEKLISDMLTFARGNTSRGEQLIDVADLLTEIEKTVSPLRSGSQALSIRLPGAQIQVRGNRRVLASAIENLIVNALQCAGDGADVRVSSAVQTVERGTRSPAEICRGSNTTDARSHFARSSVNAASGRLVCIEVKDNGPGISSGDEDRIFEPFFSERPGGTGLGLSAARSIIRAHHGELTLHESGPGGACFRIQLPLLETSSNKSQTAVRTLQ